MDNVNPARIAGICSECKTDPATSFCNLTASAAVELRSLTLPHSYLRGATLFLEGQPSKGVFILCSGRVKLSTYSEEGRAIILRIAEEGEILGLSAVVQGLPYEKTAQATDDCRVVFVQRQDFLDLIQTNHEAALNALQQLSRNYHKAHIQICSLGLSSSVGDKLAKLFLQWCEASANGGGPVRIPRTYTHGDFAEMIGTSRETVTRLLKDFKDRGLITLSKTEICIPDSRRLKMAIGSKHRNGNGHS